MGILKHDSSRPLHPAVLTYSSGTDKTVYRK